MARTPRPPSSNIDWIAAERSPEFRELQRRRKRFVLPATIFFLAWYFGFIFLAGYAEGFMGESVYEGLTVGYTLALTQFVMVWGLGWLYLRKSDRVFDPLARKAAAKALEKRDGNGGAGRRDERPDEGPPPGTVRAPEGGEVRRP
jgi:uncharacterized membrane protein (DUF485 family)